ncbi:hypothetical protein HK099_007370 [Clydaea vesicula]|uniref:Uncharacterized protein n=1 Tax=Clydaea vesicula TaxID=447962 RepID=A0AAD5U032_9FUNG|nr:hypothetical protein HK099_007370 [Clydaea vesicula]
MFKLNENFSNDTENFNTNLVKKIETGFSDDEQFGVFSGNGVSTVEVHWRSVNKDFDRRKTLTKFDKKIYLQQSLGRKTEEEEEKSLIKIQSISRMHLKRTKYLKMRSSALLIQSTFRKRLKPQRNFYSKNLLPFQIKCSTLKIQSLFRMYLTKKRFVDVKSCVLKIQSAYRMYLKRKKINSILKIQSMYRMHLTHKKFSALKCSALKIQSLTRMYLVRKNFVLLKCCTIKIQSITRMYLTRKKFFLLKCCTSKIQSITRMYLTRKKFVLLKCCTSKVQSITRMYLTRKKFVLLKCCTLKIQSITRMHLVRLNFNKLSYSALKIQSAFRSFSHSKKFKVLRNMFKSFEATNSDSGSEGKIVYKFNNNFLFYFENFNLILKNLNKIGSWYQKILVEIEEKHNLSIEEAVANPEDVVNGQNHYSIVDLKPYDMICKFSSDQIDKLTMINCEVNSKRLVKINKNIIKVFGFKPDSPSKVLKNRKRKRKFFEIYNNATDCSNENIPLVNEEDSINCCTLESSQKKRVRFNLEPKNLESKIPMNKDLSNLKSIMKLPKAQFSKRLVSNDGKSLEDEIECEVKFYIFKSSKKFTLKKPFIKEKPCLVEAVMQANNSIKVKSKNTPKKLGKTSYKVSIPVSSLYTPVSNVKKG